MLAVFFTKSYRVFKDVIGIKYKSLNKFTIFSIKNVNENFNAGFCQIVIIINEIFEVESSCSYCPAAKDSIILLLFKCCGLLRALVCVSVCVCTRVCTQTVVSFHQ